MEEPGKLRPRIGLTIEGKGKGEPVILLHSSASSGRQWRHLKRAIGDRYRLLALDLCGYGETPLPLHPEGFRLEQEVTLVEQVMEHIEGPFHLVGHSYGGAVALKTALKLEHTGRIRSLYVHEPVLFSLLRLEGKQAEWDEITSLCAGIGDHVDHGRNDEAAKLFIDYWSGPGTWDAIPEQRKPDYAAHSPKVVLDFTALFAASDPLSAYGDLKMPMRVTSGNTGPLPARRVAELLGRARGDGALRIIDGVGHMAPVTDPERVNPEIIAHLAANPLP